MREINTIKHKKIWGYEIWLYSPLKGKETTFVDTKTKNQRGPLVKIIKAKKPLSVQVHPDDQLARKLENQECGKNESWYVLEAEKEAEIIVGLTNYDNKIIKQAITDNDFEKMLVKINPQVGDFLNIPAGLIHGIGAGITVLEVQQPSDLTYRYYDYNRQVDGKQRPLHIEKALAAQKQLDYHLRPKSDHPLTYENEVGKQSFAQGRIKLGQDSIIVNLATYQTYLALKNEIVDLPTFAIIDFN